MKMIIKTSIYFGLVMMAFSYGCTSSRLTTGLNKRSEPYRPGYHFTPEAKWMNDPNGMVYLNGKYHLFFQYNPDSTIWGPMHWAHAISKDMVHWDEQPIALYPDSLGTIFSGSAVIDHNNTAGFWKKCDGSHFYPPQQKNRGSENRTSPISKPCLQPG